MKSAICDNSVNSKAGKSVQISRIRVIRATIIPTRDISVHSTARFHSIYLAEREDEFSPRRNNSRADDTNAAEFREFSQRRVD